MLPIGRRGFFLTAAAAVAGTVLPPAARAVEETLGRIAAAKGLLFGSPLRTSLLQSDPDYAAIALECNIDVCGYMHWRLVAPSPTVTQFTEVDAAHRWAVAHGMKFRGHALAWHLQMPPWFEALADRRAAVLALQNHIRTLCTHFAGAMQSWDVVNEPIQTNGRPDRLRKTPLLEKIGPEYLDIAFEAAREADPRPMLVLNENAIESDVPDQRNRRAALLRLIDGFKRRNTPIDAIGIQSHMSTANPETFKQQVLSDFLKEISDRGLKIMITEMDVTDTGSPTDIAKRDAEVAALYKRYLDAALDNRAVIAVITWGLTDKDSWITRGALPQFIRKDGLPGRPLPFDAQCRRKPAYYAIAQALAAAPAR